MESKENHRTIILGGGPAGVSAGYELSRQGFDCIVVEKFQQVGGLAKTLQFGKYRTDIGPHRFYSKNQFLYDMIHEVLKEDWILVNRLTHFYIRGKFFKYPVEIKDALKNLGFANSFRAFFDYLYSQMQRTFLHPPIKNFEDYVVLEFGRILADLNMINYTEKIWGIPCSRISADWARQRIRGLSLLAVLKKALFKGIQGPKTLVDQFYYPKLGASQTYELLAENIKKQGGRVMLSTKVVNLNHNGEKITSVVVRDKDEKDIELPSEFVISSIPLTELIEILRPEVPDEILVAARNLKWRHQVYLYLELNKKRVSFDNWIYFPDKEIPFGRFHEPKNFSAVMSPEESTTLWVEHFVFKDDERWNCSADRLFEITIKDLERLDFVKPDEIVEYRKHQEEYVYPIYDLEYETHVKTIKDYLKIFSNLQLIGRGGRFRYNNQDHSIETGILAARNIIEKGNYDLEKVGSEQEYFEKGYLKADVYNTANK